MSRYGHCLACKTPLLQPHGFHGTDLCGPCSTGEADTAGKVTVQCIHFGCPNVREVAPQPGHELIDWSMTCTDHARAE